MSEKKKGGIKILYLIFSVAVAISLWVYVVYVENPMLEAPVPVSKIPIEFTGEDLLRDYDLIVSNIDTTELTAYFSGRFRDGPKIQSLEVRAVVDLTDILRSISPTGVHTLEYDLIYDDSGTITLDHVSVPSVEVTVEHLTTVNIPIRAIYSGSIAEGYIADTLTLSRDTVTVSGTEAAVGRIAYVTATLSRDNLTRTATEPVDVRLFDENDDEIDPEDAGITFVNNTGTVVITQNVLMVKEVALEVLLIETKSVNSSNIRVELSQDTIRLSGDPEVLEGLNVINLGTVDLKSFTTLFEGDFQIKIPNDTTNLSGYTTVKVTITVQDPEIDIRRLSTSIISYINAGEGDNVEITTMTVPVVIRGQSEYIGEVIEENIRIVADLSNVAGFRGEITVPARVYVDGFPMVDAIGDYTVTVFIS